MRDLLLSAATRSAQQSTLTGRPRPTVFSMLGTYAELLQYSSLKEPQPTEREMSLLVPRGAMARDTSGREVDRRKAYTVRWVGNTHPGRRCRTDGVLVSMRSGLVHGNHQRCVSSWITD